MWSINDDTIDLLSDEYHSIGEQSVISVNGGQYKYQTVKRTIQRHEYNIRTIDRYIKSSKGKYWSYWSRNVIKRHNQAFTLNDSNNGDTSVDNNKSNVINFNDMHDTIVSDSAYSVSELVIQDKLIMDLLIEDSMTIKCAIDHTVNIASGNQQSNQQSKTRIFIERKYSTHEFTYE